ncbi:hypothetical protein [Cellulomonas cellasea]|uniref:DUF5666 domain-containing protein n=1 Tax=Cellulomonas cellasea TaxID=43670 RepID=A0A7W4YCG1_9CELL|nr:hypothetical protein [Cellulomonas cellasea]MBB2924069.1 hypothetical protein [Cellulomonas cellasea]
MTRTRTRLAALIPVLTVLPLAGACSAGDELPGREPDVTGVVEQLTLTGASDPYYEGMSLAGGEDTVVVDAAGEPATTAGLVDGDDVEVWVDDACNESRPVQCTVEAVRVHG